MKPRHTFLFLVILLCCLAFCTQPAEARWWGFVFDEQMKSAVKKGNTAKVDRYLKLGARPDQYYYNKRTELGSSLLGHAIQNSHYEMTKLLIKYGANVNYASHDGWIFGWTPLLLATTQLNAPIVQLLIENGANINTKPHESDITALQLATMGRSLPIVKLLVENGAEINAIYKGKTALLIAANKGYLDIVNLLIENKAQINAKSTEGNTALHYAANRGDLEMVKSLVEHSANHQITNNNNTKPIHLAYKRAKETGDCHCYHYLAKVEGLSECCPNTCCSKQQ